MNKYILSFCALSSFILMAGCTNFSSSGSDPLCQKWKFSSIRKETKIKIDDTVASKKQNMNEAGNMPVSLQYNNDGTFEREDMVSWVQTSDSKGKWSYANDKKKIVEVNESTGHTDTLTIINLSGSTLIVQRVDSLGNSVTQSYTSSY